LWLIDHGAALYFHHGWKDGDDLSAAAFTAIRDHVLLRFADALREADAALPARLTPAVIAEIVALVPEPWLLAKSPFASAAAARDAYTLHLTRRLKAPRAFAEEAIRARSALV